MLTLKLVGLVLQIVLQTFDGLRLETTVSEIFILNRMRKVRGKLVY
jgi:hypothetical protein